MENDQKAKTDAGKPRLSLVPRKILWAVAAIRGYGNKKYPNGGPDNWRQVEPERYRDVAYRHFMAYLDDPYGVDEESGLPHLWHCACNIAFLCELDDEKIKENLTETKKTERPLIFSTDFDGTLCEERWPHIGEPNTKLIEYLKQKKEEGNRLILNTCREGKELEEAVRWCEEKGLKFDAVNDNVEQIKEIWGREVKWRKIFANVYIDDHNMTETEIEKNGLEIPYHTKGKPQDES